LDGRAIYQHAKTAGYLYEARLRARLTERLGVEWTPVRNGIADIDGVPDEVLRVFSRRRAEIEAELLRRGESSAAAARMATLSTRQRKDYGVLPEQLIAEWRTRAARLGFDREALWSVLSLDARGRPAGRTSAEPPSTDGTRHESGRLAATTEPGHEPAFGRSPAGAEPTLVAPSSSQRRERSGARTLRNALPRQAYQSDAIEASRAFYVLVAVKSVK